MNKSDKSDKALANNYLSELNDKISKIYEIENEQDELKNLIKNIDMIKLDNKMDFQETFKNQLFFLIKPDEYKNFFDFKTKKDSSILDFIINYAIKLKSLNQENKKIDVNAGKKGKNEKESKNKNKKKIDVNISNENNNKNEDVKNNKNINNSNSKNSSSSFSYSSSLFFSINTSNLFDYLSENKSLKNDNQTQEDNKNEEQNLNKDKEFNIKKNNEDLLFLRKDFKFEDFDEKKGIEKTKKIKIIRSLEDTSEINGKSFEYDTINYIFQKIYTNSINKDFYITYDFHPDMDKINIILKNHGLLELKGIQFDFIINDLRISELIDFLIDIHLGILPNSKISFVKDNNFFSIEDLNALKNKEEYSNERIDIIGEVGVNIFNEDEKNEQLLKYSKLIYNINCLIRDEAEDLSYLLDLLNLNGNNKKLLLFITDGSYSNIKKINNNKFKDMQKILSVDSLLVFRNKNSLFRTKILEKIFKSYKKEENISFNEDLLKSYKAIIEYSEKSIFYEKVIKNLSLIEKKISYISNNLYNFFINKKLFIQLCEKIMEKIVNNEMEEKISIDVLKEHQKLFDEIVKNETLKKKIYIIYDKKNENNVEKDDLIKLFNEKDDFSFDSKLNILNERRKNNYKIIIFFVDINYFDADDNFNEFKKLIKNYQINKSPLLFFIKDDKTKKRLEIFSKVFKLNFEFIYKFEDLLNVINNIKNNNYKNYLYQGYNELIFTERLYKFLIEEYIIIFNKSIFGNKKKNYDKYELLFLKISQDIQFFQKFNFDNNISLQEETKNDIINIIKSKDILNLIDEFIDESKILTEINKTLSEFEETIDESEKIKNDNNIYNNILNENNQKKNDETNEKNGDNNYKNEIEIIQHNNINNGNKNEIIQENNINNGNEKEIIQENNINNGNESGIIQDNNINNENKNEIINNDGKKEEKSEISNQNDDNNSSDKNLALLKEIEICENIMNNKSERKEKKIKEGKEYKFFIFKNFIKENLKGKIKNELLNIVYVILQKSIIHQFEKKLLKEIYELDKE